MPIQLSATEKAGLDRLEPELEQGFLGGAEQPPGTNVILALDNYNQPMVVDGVDQSLTLKPKIKAPFKMVVASIIRAMWPSWSAISFLNSWRQWPDGTQAPCQYRKNLFGGVRIRGVFSAPSNPRTIMFNLPAGYRPSTVLIFPVTTNDDFGIVQISPNGDVYCRVGPTGNAPTSDTTWYSLSNISFEAEA